jgi:hypothetical protein
MNAPFFPRIKRALLVFGALGLGWAANAQSTGTGTMQSDTSHYNNMHHHRGHRDGGDSLARKEGFRRGNGDRNDFRRGGEGEGGQGEWASGRREGRGWGREGFRPGAWGDRGHGVHYTPEQRKQVITINRDYRQKSADLFKIDNSTLREYKAGLIALQKDKKSKLEALLTQEQKDQLARRRKRMAENVQVMAAARLERLKIRLKLSDDQVVKIKAGQEGLMNQSKSIHENQDLLPQQKMEQMKALMDKRNDTYKSVLTPDQYAQFERMSHRGPGGPGGFGGHGYRGGSSDHDQSK